MGTNLGTKATVIFGVILACVVGLTCFHKGADAKTRFRFPTSLTALKENVGSRINLGLDLRGGMHLILQVQVEDAINVETDQLAERLKTALREQNITYEAVRKTDLTRVQITGIPAEQLQKAREFLTAQYQGAYILGSLGGDQSGYVLEMTPSYQAQIRQDTLRAAMETIRRRVDSLGVAEPTIAEHGGAGEYQILVQLPGVDDPARVKNILQSTALLEIKLVKEGPFTSESEGLAKFGGILPPDGMLLPHLDVCATTVNPNPQWYLVTRSAAVTGRDLRNARSEVNPEMPGAYQVAFSLSRDGAARFGPFTEQNINRPLAVVLDNKIQSVATIQSRIEDSGRITGQFSLQCATDLALVLRSGALPASIKYLEERTVGPSLGADSIRAGFLASVAGLIAVAVFMLFYYRLSGINAILGLALNLVILMAALAYFGATLTLPGIAGVALTIGMAVDTNVLVFERIREELRAGKSIISAIENGFDRAWVAVFDTHVTTIVSALFLFTFGTGPIKGFAVTLTIGLASNLFTGIYLSRAIFEFLVSRRPKMAALSI
ncbi:MAG TPA: protein translocase subunit SecD [Candidatus Xenobia bacterium]|nr:protein translocase subunit SecD [Candidatus Xenobia bacterium]